MECRKGKNRESCKCTYGCERQGVCCECVRHHRESDELPACYFSKEAEKNYDRSIEAFIADYRNRK